THATYSGNGSTGTLTVTDGVHTANISLEGDYLLSSWDLSSDGHGGTVVIDPVGWPYAANIGVPAGTTLTTHNGDLIIDTDGAVVSGLDIHGTVYINANNVTLVNCKVTDANWVVVRIANDMTGVVVQNCEINGVGTGNDGSAGILGQGRFLANNI